MWSWTHGKWNRNWKENWGDAEQAHMNYKKIIVWNRISFNSFLCADKWDSIVNSIDNDILWGLCKLQLLSIKKKNTWNFTLIVFDTSSIILLTLYMCLSMHIQHDWFDVKYQDNRTRWRDVDRKKNMSKSLVFVRRKLNTLTEIDMVFGVFSLTIDSIKKDSK